MNFLNLTWSSIRDQQLCSDTNSKIDRKEDGRPGWDPIYPPHVRFRVYSRNEFHYSFESTKYLYYGVDDERAPRDATEIIFKDGIERIGVDAFDDCFSLKKITIPDTVTRIGDRAFRDCTSLQSIQLPPNLQYIGEYAFFCCTSLEAIYIPPTIIVIDRGAFWYCKSLRIINIPDAVQSIGNDILRVCDDLVTDATIDQGYLQWIRNHYNTLHNLCWDSSVTANNIQQYFIQMHHDGKERARTKDKPQFTALHLLAANPSVTGDMITAYLHFAPGVATMYDNKGKTPLHMLCAAPSLVDGTGSAIETYLGGHIEWRQAAFMKDDEGKTPFDYLFEKNFDELLFLENKSFAGLMVWWYSHCLDISLFAEDFDEKENF